jgi:hypothetical protein
MNHGPRLPDRKCVFITLYEAIYPDLLRFVQRRARWDQVWDLQQIHRGIAGRADGPDARIVINVANLRSTQLAWDVGAALSEVLIFDCEVVLHWDNPQDWFTQDYCLIFRAPAG